MVVGIKNTQAEGVGPAVQIGVAHGAARGIVQHRLIFGKAHELIPDAQIGSAGIGQRGEADGHAPCIAAERQPLRRFVGPVVHADAVDDQRRHRRGYLPEVKHADTVSRSQIQAAVRGHIIAGVHPQGAGEPAGGSVLGGMGRFSRQAPRLIQGVNAAVLQQPQLSVPLVEIEDRAGTDAQAVQPAESPVRPIIQVAARADKGAAAVLLLQYAQHHAVLQPLLVAEFCDRAVLRQRVDPASGAARQQRAVGSLNDAEDRLRLQPVVLIIEGGDLIAPDQGEAVLRSNSHRAVPQLEGHADTRASQPVALVKKGKLSAARVIAHKAQLGVGAAPKAAAAVHHKALHRSAVQRPRQGVLHRTPAAVEGQQSLVHGGIVPSARRGHGIDVHIRQTRREVGRGKAAGAVADQPLVGGGEPDVALGVQSGAVHRVGARARMGIPLRAVGGDPRKALLARDQYISPGGNVDSVVVGRVRHLVGLHREGRAVQSLTTARDLRQR